MRIALGAIGLAVLVVIIGAPLAAWPPVVRLPAVLVPALVLALLVARPWQGPPETLGNWAPSGRQLRAAGLLVFLLLFWYVLTRFQSGQINAIDFTIYYDRPCAQTVKGRPLFVEVSDTPGHSYRTELADHAYWGMLGVCGLYALRTTPLWLHALSALAITAGAFHVLRITQRLCGSGLLACAAALAFVLNDNTARTLNYGFHPEVFYAWFVPFMIDAGLRRARAPFLAAVGLCVLVKEDAFLPLFAGSLGLALTGFGAMSATERVLFVAAPPVLGLFNLAAYYQIVIPLLTQQSSPSYAHFWGNFGDTPLRAFVGMCRHPRRVAEATLTSGVFRTLRPFLFLPILGWRWSLGIVPIIALYAASVNDQVRAFGIYYAIVLVPFLAIAAAVGALALARRFFRDDHRARLAAATALVLGAFLVGSGNRGYSLRPWRAEVGAVPEALRQLGNEPLVLVQSGLFPHAGYDERHRLLTPETLDQHWDEAPALLLAEGIGAYPFRRGALTALMQQPTIGPMPAGLAAVRASGPRPAPPPSEPAVAVP